MKTVIEIYVRSFSIAHDLGSLIYGAKHSVCAPELFEQEMAKFKGRALDSESAALLNDLSIHGKQMKEEIRIVDIGRLRGRLKALMNGVRRAPAVMYDGNVYVGLENSRWAVQSMNTEEDADRG